MIDPTEQRAVITDETSSGDTDPVTSPGIAATAHGDNGAGAGGDGTPGAPLTLVTGGIALGVAIAVAVALFVVAQAIPGPDTPDDAAPALIAARVGEYLARWGLALVVVSFIPAIVVAVLSAFVYPSRGTAGVSTSGVGDAYARLIEALPGLLRTAPGIGVAVLLLSVLLLLGNAFNGDGSGGSAGGNGGSGGAPTASPATASPSTDATDEPPLTQP